MPWFANFSEHALKGFAESHSIDNSIGSVISGDEKSHHLQTGPGSHIVKSITRNSRPEQCTRSIAGKHNAKAIKGNSVPQNKQLR
jgi:hypothetical protein